MCSMMPKIISQPFPLFSPLKIWASALFCQREKEELILPIFTQTPVVRLILRPYNFLFTGNNLNNKL